MCVCAVRILSAAARERHQATPSAPMSGEVTQLLGGPHILEPVVGCAVEQQSKCRTPCSPSPPLARVHPPAMAETDAPPAHLSREEESQAPEGASVGGSPRADAGEVLARLLKSLDFEFEEELVRLRERARDAQAQAASLASLAVTEPGLVLQPQQPLRTRRAWHSSAGRSPGPSGDDPSVGETDCSLVVPPAESTAYARGFYPPSLPPHAHAPEDASQKAVPPTVAPAVTRLSFAERRAYAGDAAAFAWRLAEDTALLADGQAGVRFAVAGLARYQFVPGVQQRALSWLSSRLRPGAPLAAEALAAAHSSDVLQLAIAVMDAEPPTQAFDAACGLCAALVDRLGDAPAQKVAQAGGLNRCLLALRSPAAHTVAAGSQRGARMEAAARLLCALVRRGEGEGADAAAADARAASAVSLQAVPVLGASLATCGLSSDPAQAAQAALGVLAALALAPCRAEAFDPVGGVEAFATALKAANATITPRLAAAAAAAALSLAAQSSDWAARLAACGAAASLSALMAACEAHSGVQRDCCTALRHLANSNDFVKASMAAAGAVAAAIAALRAHNADCDVSAAALKALACFSAAQSNNVLAVSRGGIEACVYAIRNHKDAPSVLENATVALYAFAFNSGGVVQALEKVSACPHGREALLVAVGAVAVGPGARDQCMSAMAVLQQTTAAFKAVEGA